MLRRRISESSEPLESLKKGLVFFKNHKDKVPTKGGTETFYVTLFSGAVEIDKF